MFFLEDRLTKALKTLIFFLSIFTVALDSKAFYEDDDLPPVVPEHKQDLNYYTERFCKHKGRSHVRIQNNHVVDCMTADTLWKVEYADNWPHALTEALTLPIYDDYFGDEQFAPSAGVVLVQEDSDDFKNMLQLRQLVNYHKLPVKLDVIKNYAEAPQPTVTKPKFLRNLQIDFHR